MVANMTVQEKTLWIKILHFPLDEPGAAFNFSQKLAKEQNWSSAYTRRATDEYRKFIFLCCVAENGASPSKVVDEVWHLHLTYTQSYWIHFCKNTLEKDIHHHPSRGGTAENHKHEEWYRDTIQLYEKIFGSSPPSDIWPHPLEEYLNNETTPIAGSKKILWAATIMALPFLFIGIVYGKWNPFTLTGPQFLWFYVFLGIFVMITYCVTGNESDAREMVKRQFPEDANVFQIARFLYGKHRAVQTAMVDLIRRDLLKVNKDEGISVFNHNYAPRGDEQNPLIVPLLKQEHGSKTSYEEISADWYSDELFVHPALENLAEFAQQRKSFIPDTIFYVVLIGTGVLRIIQGLSNNRPVTFLVIEIVVLSFLLNRLIRMLSVNTAIFKEAEALFKKRLDDQQGHPDDLVNKFVVQGPNAILGFAEGILLLSVFTAYDPIVGRQRGDGGFGGCSGGGSSCSGGSSCGGGGCGGCGGGGD